MRSTKELLTIVSQNMYRFRSGLCSIIGKLEWEGSISQDEYHHLKKYLKEHRPFNVYTITDDAYYWKKGELTPRMRWLKRHIRRNK